MSYGEEKRKAHPDGQTHNSLGIPKYDNIAKQDR